MRKTDTLSVNAQGRGRPREFDRDKALDAAMEVFWRKGFMQSTLNDLCAAMGIKPPSFYCAFGTRESLFLETLRHYEDKYWAMALHDFFEEPDFRIAFGKLFEHAATTYTRPNLPRGCFVSVSITGLGPGEKHIEDMLVSVEAKSMENFRKRLLRAIDDGQIPPDSDVAAISGAIMAFLKGVAALSRTEICRAELTAIASLGLLLLPPTSNIQYSGH